MEPYVRRWEATQTPYIHYVLVIAIVVAIIAICCWGLGPNSWRNLLGYEGLSMPGVGTQGCRMINMSPLAEHTRALSSFSPTSAHRNYLDQSQVYFMPSASDIASMPGIMPQGMWVRNPYREIGDPYKDTSWGFLGGPEAPLFSAPPGATNLTSHQYPQAIDSAQQALAAGYGKSGAEAAAAAEGFYGGDTEGFFAAAAWENILPKAYDSRNTGAWSAHMGMADQCMETLL